MNCEMLFVSTASVEIAFGISRALLHLVVKR